MPILKYIIFAFSWQDDCQHFPLSLPFFFHFFMFFVPDFGNFRFSIDTAAKIVYNK